MPDYLLFLDTEASGLPKRWDLPYSAKDNWPFCVQVSWVISTIDGQVVKQENHYIKETDFEISRSATKIHGITQLFLQKNGQGREEVMKMFSDDVIKYQPVVIGHFMEFDFHLIAADLYRTGIENPVQKEMTFCTMLATIHLVKSPVLKFFRLGELYEDLFNVALENQHDALVDAKATAECFFELVKRGEITDEIIALQQKEAHKTVSENKGAGCTVPMFFIISSIFLIIYFL